IGLTYAYDRSSIITGSDASRQLFEQLAFRNFAGADQLKGIVTSKLLPVFSYNSVNATYNPTNGKSLYISADLSGLGGSVRSIRPVVDYKQFIPMHYIKHAADGHQVLGYHVQGTYLTGYGGRVAPPFERFYLGGDNDLRGFDIRAVSPVAFLINRVDSQLVNPDDPCVGGSGSACIGVPLDPTNPRRGNYTIPLPVHQLVFPGG